MKKSHPLLIPLIATAFVLLLMTIRSYELFASGNVIFLYGGLFLNCLAWLIVGHKMKLMYFVVSGILGTLIILYFIIHSFEII